MNFDAFLAAYRDELLSLWRTLSWDIKTALGGFREFAEEVFLEMQ